jgi:amidophosphoribosyltransferase
MLAMEHPVQADMVIGVPDSGTTAAIGYAQQSGIPFGEGLIKNRYVGRTFIQPEQKMREEGVKVKLNALRETVKGKRIVMVDDSIVRGTTSRQIVDMLKDAGATEVHMRISSPPVQYPCYFGIDTPSREHLIGATHSVKEISEIIGVDSLGYLSLDGLVRSIAETVGSDEFDALSNPYCMACFDGRYPMEVSCERQKAFSKGTRR